MCDVEILAYCFMPDHVHYLAEGLRENANLHNHARRFRQRTGYAFRRQQAGYLWQDGYFDRHLRNEDATFDVIRYIVANPVRAGLCSSPEQYAFSGAAHYALNELGGFVQWRPGRSPKGSRSDRYDPLG